MLYVEIKERLDAVVDKAFGDSPDIAAFKKYYLDLSERVTKSALGTYTPERNRIRVYGCGSYGSSQIIITCLHELAHHIDSFSRPTKIHGQTFWETYASLVRAALDIRVISKDDVEWYAHASNAADKNKVLSLSYGYTPSEDAEEFGKGKYRVYVYDCYSVKDDLKTAGFTYRAQDRSWVIEIEQERVMGCRNYLSNLGLPCESIEVHPASEVYLRSVG